LPELEPEQRTGSVWEFYDAMRASCEAGIAKPWVLTFRKAGRSEPARGEELAWALQLDRLDRFMGAVLGAGGEQRSIVEFEGLEAFKEKLRFQLEVATLHLVESADSPEPRQMAPLSQRIKLIGERIGPLVPPVRKAAIGIALASVLLFGEGVEWARRYDQPVQALGVRWATWLGHTVPYPRTVAVPSCRTDCVWASAGANGTAMNSEGAVGLRGELAPSMHVGVTEVTFEQYHAFCEATGREKPRPEREWYDANVEYQVKSGDRDDHPVVNVTWREASAYARWLDGMTGSGCRLPTGDEWEYAARGGSSTAYWWGDAPTRLGEVMMKTRDPREQSARSAPAGNRRRETTASVGQFPPNPFGLHDVHGNVWEWVSDDAIGEWVEGCQPGVDDEGEAGGVNCSYHFVRGGAWDSHPSHARLAVRRAYNRGDSSIGFRVWCSLPTPGSTR
ncbi:MAG: SUMF1/EgtB/PvdO family nonheme iron enzyme, partial [Pseudomonadota bacterium]